MLSKCAGETISGRSANTTDGARLEMAASGFWGGWRERTFLVFKLISTLKL